VNVNNIPTLAVPGSKNEQVDHINKFFQSSFKQQGFAGCIVLESSGSLLIRNDTKIVIYHQGQKPEKKKNNNYYLDIEDQGNFFSVIAFAIGRFFLDIWQDEDIDLTFFSKAKTKVTDLLSTSNIQFLRNEMKTFLDENKQNE